MSDATDAPRNIARPPRTPSEHWLNAIHHGCETISGAPSMRARIHGFRTVVDNIWKAHIDPKAEVWSTKLFHPVQKVLNCMATHWLAHLHQQAPPSAERLRSCGQWTAEETNITMTGNFAANNAALRLGMARSRLTLIHDAKERLKDRETLDGPVQFQVGADMIMQAHDALMACSGEAFDAGSFTWAAIGDIPGIVEWRAEAARLGLMAIAGCAWTMLRTVTGAPLKVLDGVTSRTFDPVVVH